jgi:hypothetical protein
MCLLHKQGTYITEVIFDPVKNLNLTSLYVHFNSVAKNPNAESVIMAFPWQHNRVPPA